MLPYQERVIQEKKELDEKLEKLDTFVRSEIYKTLPVEEQNRLLKQYSIMESYSHILNERIVNFN